MYRQSLVEVVEEEDVTSEEEVESDTITDDEGTSVPLPKSVFTWTLDRHLLQVDEGAT